MASERIGISDAEIERLGTLSKDDQAGEVSGAAYQVIGSLAHEAGLFDHPEVIRALDYFGYEQWRDGSAEILPFVITQEKTDGAR